VTKKDERAAYRRCILSFFDVLGFKEMVDTLRRMSDYLSRLKSFQVDTTAVDEKFTADGHKVQQLQSSRVLVERPDALRVDRVSPAGRTSFRYDGKRFGVVNSDHNVYATAEAPPRLDAAIDDARSRLQLDTPGGDLLVSDPYRALTEGAIEGRYIGLEPIDGTMAHHIAVTKKGTTCINSGSRMALIRSRSATL
jgi:hypothetical protein